MIRGPPLTPEGVFRGWADDLRSVMVSASGLLVKAQCCDDTRPSAST